MEPIAKKKATVSPFNKLAPNEPIEEDTSNNTSSNPIITDAVSPVVAPVPPRPNPNVDDEGTEINVPSSDAIIRNQTNEG